MKQVAQNYKSGNITVEDVARPALKPGGVLVRTLYSVISIGTEGMKVREGRLSYLGKARARPDHLAKVLHSVRQQGFIATYQKVMNRLDTLTPLGYSLAGEVVAVGTGAEEFRVGQRVACAGAGYANHAELNYIPKNLVVAVPEGVALKHAAFATLGAIALQGFRRSEMQLGETACVVGLGLLGQVLVQILRAAGMQAIGVDLLRSRCRLAEQLGAKAAMTPDDADLASSVHRLTGGHGVDCVFIASGGSSNAAAELAVAIARDRARVVDIGKTRLDLPWNDYYQKELDVRFSRSYGPGRYDPLYEERGIDYPIGYVRWTERRNLASFLELVADGRVSIEPLVSAVHPFGVAERVYREIAESDRDLLGIVFEYRRDEHSSSAVLPKFAAPESPSGKAATIRLGVIGAGAYACSMLLPHLARDRNVELVTVATTTGLSGQNATKRFGFRRSVTDYGLILDDPDIDAVLIATRHATHARLVCESLRAGKTVYVEKPLALDLQELSCIREAIIESGNDRLMVGYNRRFAPLVREIGRRFSSRAAPLVMHYRVHAGRLDQSSWYLDEAEGSRFLGEAGHFFDLFACFAGARPTSVCAAALRPARITPDDLENIAATVQYENGSVGNLLYLTQGGARVPKEHLELHGGGKTALLSNFESIGWFEAEREKRIKARSLDKGQPCALEAFALAVKSSASMPISAESLFDTTLLCIGARLSAARGEPVHLDELRQALNAS